MTWEVIYSARGSTNCSAPRWRKSAGSGLYCCLLSLAEHSRGELGPARSPSNPHPRVTALAGEAQAPLSYLPLVSGRRLRFFTAMLTWFERVGDSPVSRAKR